MEEAIRALLLSNAPVAALCGNRVNWGTHPQGAALPGVVLNVISGAPGYTLTSADGLTPSRVQVDCYANSYGAAKALARAVTSALSGHRSGGLRGVFLQNEQDSREGGSNEATRPWRVRLDFTTVWRMT
jgi:hypothetical protein